MIRSAMNVQIWLLCAVSVCISFPGWALDCKNAVTTLDINDCASREYKASDERLNAAYRRALSRIDKESSVPVEARKEYRQFFLESQRKWIGFRDAQCALARFDAYGGSMATSLVIGCLKQKTDLRVKDLDDIAVDR